MTHAELVERAVRWLANSRGCDVVLREQAHGMCSEIPDAIGWAPGVCVVVEAKVSLVDLRADRGKQCHRNGEALGDERWILTAPGVVLPTQVPYGHGLIEAHANVVRVVVPAPARDVTWRRLRAECEYLRVELSASWRCIRERAALASDGGGK